METMIFKTPCQTEREARDLAIYNEYNALIAVEGQSKTLVTEHLMKKYNIHSAGTIYLIRRRVGMPDLNMDVANTNPDRYLTSAETGYPNVTGTNQGVILEIRRERAIELDQEGFRYDDLMRWKAGYCVDQDIYGMYFPGPGEYDLSGDGNTDVILYASGTAKPEAGSGVLVYEIGKDILLTESNQGYLYYHKNIVRNGFNEGRDYLYPIPINERSLNPNLTQNPGWVDGLDF